MKTAFCFDLDGTITQQEILPLIASDIGLQEEFDLLTDATINGVLPFSSSLKLRCRLLTGASISRAKAVVLQVDLFKKVVEFIKQNIQYSFIVTGNIDVWIEDLVKKIGCTTYSSKANYVGDQFIGVSEILDKGEAVKDIRSKGFDRIVAIGDGMGDVDMFRQADVSIFFSEDHQPAYVLKDICDYLIFDERTLYKILSTFL